MNDLKYSESNGWAGLSIGLVLVTFIAVGACYSLHNRRKEDESAENEFDEGGEIDDYYLKVWKPLINWSAQLNPLLI